MKSPKALLLALALSGCQGNLVNHDAASIRDVLSQRGLLRERFLQAAKTPPMVFDEAGYRAALHKIDPSSCPDRFKAAWHDYLYAGDKDIGLGHRINALTALKSWQLVDPDAEVKDAWSHCESVAIEFGVDPVKAYAQ